MKKGKKKKKNKITYIDDGRTIADMSGVSGGFSSHKGKSRSTAREQWKTYTQAVRMMFLPMLIVIGIICLAYLITYLLL